MEVTLKGPKVHQAAEIPSKLFLPSEFLSRGTNKFLLWSMEPIIYFSKFGPWSTALESSGWLLEKQVPALYLRFTELEFLGGPRISILTIEFHSSSTWLIFRSLKSVFCPVFQMSSSYTKWFLLAFFHMSILFVPSLCWNCVSVDRLSLLMSCFKIVASPFSTVSYSQLQPFEFLYKAICLSSSTCMFKDLKTSSSTYPIKFRLVRWFFKGILNSYSATSMIHCSIKLSFINFIRLPSIFVPDLLVS